MQDTASVRRFSFDTVAVWALSLSAFGAAVIFSPWLSGSSYSTKVSLLALVTLIAFIAYIVARLIRGSIVIPPLGLLGVVWLLPLAYGLSALFSGANPQYSFFGTEFEPDTVGFVVLLALITSLAALAFRRASDYRVFFYVAAAAIGAALLVQIGIIAASRGGVDISGTYSIVGSFQDLGAFAGLGVVLSLMALRFLTLRTFGKTIISIGLLLSLFILALVNVVFIWVLVALFSLALFIETILRRRGEVEDADLEGAATLSVLEESGYVGVGTRSLLAPLAALLVSLFFLIGGASLNNSIAGAFGLNAIDVRPSWQSTFSVGSHTYAASPFFGSGPGTFGEKWLLFRDRTLNDTLFWNIDFPAGIGFIPTSFVTTGIVGVFAWLLCIGCFLFAGVRALLFRLPEDTFLRFVSLASFSGAAYTFALALFGHPGIAVFAFGFFSLGIFISVMRHGTRSHEWGIIFARNPRVGFAIVFLLTLLLLASVASAYVVLERYLAHASYTKAVSVASSGDIDSAETHLIHSLSLVENDRTHRLLVAVYLERMRRIANDTELAPTMAQQQFQNALTAAVNSGLEATRLNPNNYQNWVALGSVYQAVIPLGIEGAYESAKAAYERAATLNPTSPVIPYVLAQIEITQGSTVVAEERLLASISLKRDYIPAILLLSQLEIRLGKAAEALQAAEAAAYFAPNAPAVLFEVGLLRSGTGDTAGAIAALTRAVELNPEYANARFFLGALYATLGRFDEALAELRTVAGFSEANATTVAGDIAELEAGRNPFPLARLRSLGIPTPPVEEPTANVNEGE
ncbi:tetratricopeptide repeat protein [Candidatus Parcubacteria bacterium]|nr:tetratricopeptide repeat protein [Candidatus Parcubacteria bacterium]